MDNPTVSIVIPHAGEKELLRECLEKFQEREYDPVELIVVNNKDKNDSKRMVENEFPEVRIVDCPVGASFGRVNNVGIEAATGKYICSSFNDDEVIEPGWISTLVKKLEENPDLGIVTGLRLKYQDNDIIDSAGGKFDKWGKQLNYMTQEREKLDESELRYVELAEVPMYHRDLLNEIGYYDEEYYLYGAEVDFCLKARREGYEVAVDPDAITYHRRTTTIPVSAETRYYLRRNKIWMSMKFFPLSAAVLSAVYWGMIRPLVETKEIVKGKRAVTLGPVGEDGGTRFDHLSALYRSVLWNVAHLPKTIYERRAHSLDSDQLSDISEEERMHQPDF